MQNELKAAQSKTTDNNYFLPQKPSAVEKSVDIRAKKPEVLLDRNSLFSAICMLVTPGKDIKRNGTGSLIVGIPNALPWICHIISSHHVISSVEVARHTVAEFRNALSGKTVSCSLDPDAYFITSELHDFTVVALSYSSSINLLQQKPVSLTLSDSYPAVGMRLACAGFSEGMIIF